ncbi:hypothetical protein ACS0TY_012705 [Phlomoides rotata]
MIHLLFEEVRLLLLVKVKRLGRTWWILVCRWALIAGRVPGRKAEEIERFWLMRNSDTLKDKRKQATKT